MESSTVAVGPLLSFVSFICYSRNAVVGSIPRRAPSWYQKATNVAKPQDQPLFRHRKPGQGRHGGGRLITGFSSNGSGIKAPKFQSTTNRSNLESMAMIKFRIPWSRSSPEPPNTEFPLTDNSPNMKHANNRDGES